MNTQSNKSIGVLNDTEIINLSKNKILVCEEFKEANVKQACYELRVGRYYYNVNDDVKRHELKENYFVVLKPHSQVVIITLEKIKLPEDILARILTKGSLFSIGILPVNTYADPGFYGRLGIVLNNASNDYLKLQYGESIAKIEFDRLQFPVSFPYHGQHGWETEIWPIRLEEHLVTQKELKILYPHLDEINEIEQAYGKKVASILTRIQIYEKRVIITTAFTFAITLILIGIALFFRWEENWLSPLLSVGLGVITNIVYGIIIAFAHGKEKQVQKGKGTCE